MMGEGGGCVEVVCVWEGGGGCVKVRRGRDVGGCLCV